MLQVILFSSTEVIFEGTSNSVILPGEQGTFEIAPLHKPLLSRLLPGDAVIDGKYFAIRSGVVKVKANEVTIMVDPEA